jgi:mRNA-degrading endonuclease RelE of RelBE toxin-antitoxin system
MDFAIELSKSAAGELAELRAFDRRRVVEEIETQLAHEPDKPTRNRKCLPGAAAGFDHVPPLWELRVGDFRVFYDVAMDPAAVFIRAIRLKTPELRTEDIIQ